MSDAVDARKKQEADEAELEEALSRAENRAARGSEILSDVFKVALGVVLGAAATFLVHWGQSLQEARIKRIDDEVSKLYCPVAVLAFASGITWDQFSGLKDLDFDDVNTRPSKRYIKTYRTWMSTTMLPLLTKLEDVITGNAGLLVDNSIPDRFEQWIAFTEWYRGKAASWYPDDDKQDNYQSREANVAPVEYPSLIDCASEQLEALKKLRESLEHRFLWLQVPDPRVPNSCNEPAGIPQRWR
jgi:hypothetical protein